MGIFKLLSVVYCLLTSMWLAAADAPLRSHIEQKICQNVDQQKEKPLLLLEKLVNINSGTGNIAGVHKVGEMLRPEFEAIGFKTRWIEEPTNMKRAGTLIAEHKGNLGKKILLIGHLDTVFPPQSPFQKYRRHGKRVIGPGVIDDKGGDIIILYTLKALYDAHVLDNMNITVVLTGDEEDSGKPTSISRKPLLDAAKSCDVALDFECAITLDTATIARRGITDWIIEAEGKEGHSSEIFQKSFGDGAIFELARILNSMRAQLASEHYLSFNPGLILGGTTIEHHNHDAAGRAFGKENVIAKRAMVQGDLRYLTDKQKKETQQKIRTIVKNHLAGTAASIRFQDGIPAMEPTPNNLELLKKYSLVSQDLGYGAVKPIDPNLRGAADISYIASLVPANLSGLGGLGTGAHSINETLDVTSLPIQIKRSALLIYRLTH